MIKEFDPLQYQFATYVIEHCIDMYDKYKHIADKAGISITDALNEGQVHILKENDFFFFKLFKDIDFNYNINLFDMKDEFGKILRYHLKDNEVTYTVDDMIIKDIKYPHCSYMDILPNQAWILEYVGVVLIQNHVKKTFKKLDTFNTTKEFLTPVEASEYSGYKKSYLYKIKSDGLIKGYQNQPGGKLLFKRVDLKEFMLRNVSNIVEDLL